MQNQMQNYLTKNNIKYNIVGINNSYKFELNNITFIYEIVGCYNYHYLKIYVPSQIFEKIYEMLEEIITLIGVIENMDIYKYEGVYKNFDEIINVLGIIKFGKRYRWIKSAI
jgi:hypothetical protein